MPQWISHLRRLTLLLRRRGRTPEEAEDLVQEAFLRLHVFLQEGNDVRETEAFLVRTVLNLSVDAHRRSHRDLYVDEPPEELPLIDLAPAPEEVLAAEQRLVRMRAVLDAQVNPRTREVYFLHRLEGFTYEEIARRMHMSVRTVEKHIARAVTALWVERQKE
jgi:RNA polymerase sigma factor (sigma-70 family)